MVDLPKIIQGGMGAGVSGWRLANAVSRTRQLGVVAGTALDVILARRLQIGDAGGHARRALAAFPLPGVARRILERYFVEGGKGEHEPFKSKPILSETPSRPLNELTVAGNFVEVFLAREGHDNPVGINYLEKIQLPTLASLFGAMLAGVGYVCMGAGIPTAIPGILDKLAHGQPVELRLDVAGAERGET
ncbi:MAG: nitronate monooxygenase, partial [Planctomycetota bacterium]|nr:nitronate monooxygenase [Planctomycetota bacterium]